jgi:hypothetical protein
MRLSRTRVNEDWANLARNLDESMSSTVIRNRVPKACGARRHQDFCRDYFVVQRTLIRLGQGMEAKLANDLCSVCLNGPDGD